MDFGDYYFELKIEQGKYFFKIDNTTVANLVYTLICIPAVIHSIKLDENNRVFINSLHYYLANIYFSVVSKSSQNYITSAVIKINDYYPIQTSVKDLEMLMLKLKWLKMNFE